MTDREQMHAWLDETAKKLEAEMKWLNDLRETVAKHGEEAVRRIQEEDGGLL